MAFTPIDDIPTGLRSMPQPEFDVAMAGFMTQLPTGVDQMNALGAYMDTQTGAAEAAAAAAAASSAAAVAAGNAAPWVSGNTYAYPTAVIGSDGRTYRKLTASSVTTTPPQNDPTNWVLLSQGASQYLHVRNQQAAGAGSGETFSANGTATRTLNTVVGNTITGASLSSNQITLPAGTYDLFCAAPSYNSGNNKAHLRNVTDSTVTLIGLSTFLTTSGGPSGNSIIVGRFTITATKVFDIQHFTANAGAGGLDSSVSVPAVYTTAIFTKVA